MVVAGADAGDFPAATPRTIAPPSHGCMAVAGPVRERSARITNLPWQLQEDALAQAAEVEQLELVNDFGVLIYGLPHFRADQQVVLQQGARGRRPPWPSSAPEPALAWRGE